MTKSHITRGVSALGRAWAAARLHGRALVAAHSAEPHEPPHMEHHLRAVLHRQQPTVRWLIYGGSAAVALTLLTTGILWWRLTSGPLSVDLMTPWLTAALEERLGGGHRIEVGGTQLERDEEGRTALRLRDIVVRDRDGRVVASAPKAEVGLSGSNLLLGRVQAERLSLIGATMAVRVENDGQVNVFAGGDQRPIAAGPVTGSIPRANMAGTPGSAPREAPAPATDQTTISAVLAWLDGLDALGLDGRDLTEVGLKNASLVVEDRRSGKHWKFESINFSLTRPREGGVALALTSSGTDGPWSLTATVAPRGHGRRAIEAVVRDISPKDILLALRVDDSSLEADIPLSAILRAEIGPDGTVHMAEGRILGGAGFIGMPNAPQSRILLDETQVSLRWDAANQVLYLPVEFHSGTNRLSLPVVLQAPRQSGDPWMLGVNRGQVMLGGADRAREPPLVLDRITLRARIDTANRRIVLDQGDLAGTATRVAVSGALDYSEAEPRLTMGMVATRMTMLTFKRLWPAFILPPLRTWVLANFSGGVIERFEVATNAPWVTLTPAGPPVPDDGLSGEIAGTATLRPVETLPAIRDADLVATFTGRTAKVAMGRGTVELPSGRKLSVSNGVFEVPDTAEKPPQGRLRMRVDGPADAAIELAGLEPLRGAAGIQLDPATTRGQITAQVAMNWPLAEQLPKGALSYNVDAEVTNFAAEKLVRGLKAEASILRVNASPQGFRVNGDARIGNAAVAVDYRKRPDGDAEARAQTVLDDAARTYLGFELGGTVSGPVPVKFSGKIAAGDRDNRFAVDADLTQAKVTDLLPGWNKPAGRAIRATFMLIEKPQSRRIEDLLIEGSGTRVRGNIEVDSSGDIMSAAFPVFALTDGDKATVKAERGHDGALKVTVRGDVYDGRGLIKSMATGPSDPNAVKPGFDLDLDFKVGAVAGFHGEALRGLELRLTRRAGHIRSFAVNARIGLDGQMNGDLRGRAGKQVIYVESADAGALFRFTDMYPRMYGGKMWVTMDPPSGDHNAKDGTLDISGFAVRGEAALERVASSAPLEPGYRGGPGRSPGVEFSRMRVEFTRSPGRLSIRDGNVWGAAVCATMDGQIDFLREDVRLRGTFVPACALNSMPSQIPVLGLFFGGPKEGVLGVTYEVVGPPNGMVLRVNPMSAVMPGIFRKLFEFRHVDDQLLTGETTR
jgi:hypothetical protein